MKPRVLVVDDERSVLRVTERLLGKLGLEVVAISSATLALQHVRDGDRAFAAVITDLDMPDLSGAELVAQLADLGLVVPALVITGKHVPVPGATHVLEKPFTVPELVAALAALGLPTTPLA